MDQDIDGVELVAEARRIVSGCLLDGHIPETDRAFRKRYGFRAGVFVTINRGDELRGCIGYPEPSGMLCDSLSSAAVAAATQDPRFDSVRPEELDQVTFEVTVLEPPQMITVKSPEEYPGRIVPGRDGLIVRYHGLSGLLLPQVATEHGWSAQDLLENTCIKAGLPRDQWKRPGTEVWRFGGTVFVEGVSRG